MSQQQLCMSTAEEHDIPSMCNVGFVLLAGGKGSRMKANMPKQCVINATQIKSVDKNSIKEKIGTLSKVKMNEVHDGLRLIMNIP